MAKSVYLVFCLSLVGINQIFALPKEFQKLAEILHVSCVNSTGVEEKFIDEARYGIFWEDAKLKCYMLCLLTTVQVVTDDGKINTDALLDLVPEPYKKLAMPIFEKCRGEKGTDLCDMAFQTNKCWQVSGPALYYLA